jgi:hypothetical protein
MIGKSSKKILEKNEYPLVKGFQVNSFQAVSLSN